MSEQCEQCVYESGSTTIKSQSAPILEDQNTPMTSFFAPGKLMRSMSVAHVDDRYKSSDAARVSFANDINEDELETHYRRLEELEEFKQLKQLKQLKQRKENDAYISAYLSSCPPLTRTIECDPTGSCPNSCCMPMLSLGRQSASNIVECSICANETDAEKMQVRKSYTVREMDCITPRPPCFYKDHDTSLFGETN
jgi:hypothetical protein